MAKVRKRVANLERECFATTRSKTLAQYTVDKTPQNY